MARFNIEDLPKDVEISWDEMKIIFGGRLTQDKSMIDRYDPEYPEQLCEIAAYFEGWQEKGNQVDQQLSSVLRTMKDLGRVGVGGSDLGAS